MTAATQSTLDLLRELIGRFIDHPAKLMIEAREHQGCVYWTMQCHADDLSKLIGRKGSHFNALRLLLAEIGRANGTQYILRRYLEPEPAARRESMPGRTITSYDPSRAVDLLNRLVASLQIGEFVVSIDQSGLAFTFNIHTRAAEDYNSLTVHVQAPRNPDQMTTIGAIGTLFRSYANREGVTFELKVHRE